MHRQKIVLIAAVLGALAAPWASAQGSKSPQATIQQEIEQLKKPSRIWRSVLRPRKAPPNRPASLLPSPRAPGKRRRLRHLPR
jgi:hypothetical protein